MNPPRRRSRICYGGICINWAGSEACWTQRCEKMDYLAAWVTTPPHLAVSRFPAPPLFNTRTRL